MTFYERYLAGETNVVYNEIYALGKDAFLPHHFIDIQRVLTETFIRVAFNLNIIYAELKKLDYVFWKDASGVEKSIIKPAAGCKKMMAVLENSVKPFGFIPLSLKMFYQIVGSCDFSWDYTSDENIMWGLADPIQIASIDEIVERITDEYWAEEMQEYINDEDYGYAFLELAGDDLHKDNISGGPPYSIQITKEPSIDTQFLNAPTNSTFIQYLRFCFDRCGFPGMIDTNEEDDMENANDFQAFFATVKPQLKMI